MNAPWSHREPQKDLFTVIMCTVCSHRDVRKFTDGDAVMMRTKCTKCADSARIEMIYSAPSIHS